MAQYYRLCGPGLLLVAALSCSGLPADAAAAAEREAVAVTVYNADLALVKELRRVDCLVVRCA